MTSPTHSDERRAAKAKADHELKKVQQRTAAIIVFSVAYHCVFALIFVGNHIQGQGRTGDAYTLVFMAGVLALLMTSGIRAILGHRILSPFWTPLALSPPIAAAIWLI